MVDYAWINDVQRALNTSTLFSATVTGAKALAMALLMFKVLGAFITAADDYEAPKIGSMLQVIGYGLIIVGSDWVVNSIESMFAGVDINVSKMNTFNDASPVKAYLTALDELGSSESGLDKLVYYFSVLKSYFVALGIYFFSSVLYLIDFAVTCMYLLQRLFLIQLFKFIFPFAIALSTTKGFEDMLARWIKTYIGLFVLGIAYIGILKFSVVVHSTIQSKIPVTAIDIYTGMNALIMMELGALLIMFMVKFSLMAMVTQEVRKFFS